MDNSMSWFLTSHIRGEYLIERDIAQALFEKAINNFVLVLYNNECVMCGSPISTKATSGMCRKCYQRARMNTKEGKEKKRRYNLKHYEKYRRFKTEGK